MTRSLRVAVGAIGCGLIVAWIVLVPLRAHAATRHVTPPSVATPTCSAGQLRLDRVGGQGFTSHREWDFILRNISSHTCKLAGFPKIKFLDGSAMPISYAVVHHGATNGVVVLHTFKRAKFAFVFTVAGPCIPHSFNAFGLRVTPPGASGNLVWFAGSTGVCNISGSSASVTAVSP
jgi:hypothetical protein